MQVLAIVELEEDHWPAGEYQGEVMQGPHQHVRGIGGVADKGSPGIGFYCRT